MNIDEAVGARVREARKRADLGQEGLADAVLERTGVKLSRTTVVRIERGERSVTIPELAALALVLSTPPAALVTPIDHGADHVDLTPKHRTEVSRAYFWWIGLEDPTDPHGYALEPTDGPRDGRYEAALRRHVTQRFFLDAHTGLMSLDRLRKMAEDPKINYSRAPSDEDYSEARKRVLRRGRDFVEAIRGATAAGLPAYGVHPDLWPYLAESVGRTDPVGWAQDEGIEPYEPEVTP